MIDVGNDIGAKGAMAIAACLDSTKIHTLDLTRTCIEHLDGDSSMCMTDGHR